MKKPGISSLAVLIAGVIITAVQGPLGAFTSLRRVPLAASVSVSGGGQTGTEVTFNVPQLLGQSVGFAQGIAFPGKNVVLPISIVTGSGNGAPAGGFAATIPVNAGVPSPTPASVQVSMLYQSFDAAGFALTPGYVTVPVAMQSNVFNPGSITGTAVIPVRDLQAALNGGSLNYKFQLKAGNQAPIQIGTGGLSNGTPFHLQFITTQSYPVSSQLSLVRLPDTDMTDGKTTIAFAPGLLSGPGTLVVTINNPSSVPTGLGGLAPLTAYDLQLQGTSLLAPIQLSLSYPANQDGTLIGSNGNAANLAPYSLSGASWEILSPYQVDTTLHQVSFHTSHLSSFALFLAAGTNAAALRPAQRIITPNGDSINDTISFTGIGGTDVRIFDIKGRRVRTLSVPNLVWDGRDDDGGIVESGIYIYQYNSQGERISGVIMVAK